MIDVLIIGNGALGLAIAHRLTAQDKTIRVAVVGPARREGAATLAAGAMLNAWAELVRHQFDYPALAERGRLRIDALALWDGLAAELAEFAPLNVRWGTLVLDSGRGGRHEREAIDTMAKGLERDGIPALVDPAHGDWPRTVLIPDGWVDSVAALDAWEKALRARGAELIDGRVTRLSREDGWRATLEDGREIKAGAVLLANGPFAQALVEQLPDVRAATPRLVFEAGSGFDVEANVAPPPVDVVRTMARGAIGGFHIIHRGGGKYYLGSTSTVTLEADWTAPDEKLAYARKLLAQELDPAFAQGRYKARPVGFRAFGADGFPLLGESHVKGLWLATGMQRDGFTSAPLVANGLAAAFLGGANPFARFAPSRKLISYKRRDEALEDAVNGYGEDKRAVFTRVYDRVGGDFGIYTSTIGLMTSDEGFAALDHPRARPEG